ncbi:MAG: hypothetical protein RJA81_2127 [Planctomycetota bacterium]|jgi:acetyl esterase/lipase
MICGCRNWIMAIAIAVTLVCSTSRAQDIFKDQVFDNEGHTLDIYRANPAGPTVFYVPGGNWYKHDKNLYTRLGVALAGYGINLVIPQYGAEQKYPNNLYDVIEAVRWAQANLSGFGIGSTQFHLVGHSAGAHLAYMSLADHRTNLSETDFLSMTLISGLYDINFLVRYGNRWRNWGPLQGWHASPIKTKRLMALPMNVIWAENDYDVVKRQTQHFLYANQKICQPLQSYIIPCEDHVSELLNADTNGLLQIVVNTVLNGSQPVPMVENSVIIEPGVVSDAPTMPVQETQSVTPEVVIPSPPPVQENSAPAIQPPVPATPPVPAAPAISPPIAAPVPMP